MWHLLYRFIHKMTRLDMEIMEYEEIKQLRQSEKSTVYLVREKDKEQILIRKILKGQHPIYVTLQNCRHPFLPKLYEVVISETDTTIIEEYIEGQSLGNEELSKKQFLSVVKELCSVLEFLHRKGIIHRDIKPSNIILTEDGHIRLIDFDAARTVKDDLEQDTKLLGTRGYAPPEQYGFAQTDERADIYALGVTLQQLLGDKVSNQRYKQIIQKCTKLDPDKRYQTVRQVKRAFFHAGRYALCGVAVLMLVAMLGIYTSYQSAPQEDMQYESENLERGLAILPSPENPHWDGETGIGVWGNVLESGVTGEVAYHWRLYKMDTETVPDPDRDNYTYGDMGGYAEVNDDMSTYEMSFSEHIKKNGFYYFTVSAAGDGVHYSDSPYVISGVFEYTGESAPPLPTPTGLEWKIALINDELQYFATWDNLDDYADKDSFHVRVYSQSGVLVTNNIWTKEQIMSMKHRGVWIAPELLTESKSPYRFTVQVNSTRPNEYKGSLMPDPVPEEYFSPWLVLDNEE